MILLLTTWTWNTWKLGFVVLNLLSMWIECLDDFFRSYSYRLLCWISLLKCTFKGLIRDFFFALVRVLVTIIFLLVAGLLPGKLVLRTYGLRVCGKSSFPVLFGSYISAVSTLMFRLSKPDSKLGPRFPQCFTDLVAGVKFPMAHAFCTVSQL